VKTGRALIAQERAENPENLFPVLLESYCQMFEVFITEEPLRLANFQMEQEERIKLVKTGDETSPYYNLILAELELQSAIGRLKFEEYISAFVEIRRAFKLLEVNDKRFPDFKANLKSLGILHALLGTIPENYQWGIKMVGMEGDIDKGIAELNSIHNSTEENHFKEEVAAFLAFFQLFLGIDYDRASQMASTDLVDPESLLHSFLRSDIVYRLGNTDDAIKVLETRPMGTEYIEFHYLEYFLGTLKLNRLDTKEAKTHFTNFVNKFKGRHYIKEAYQRLAWIALLNDDEEQYFVHMENCASKGYTLVDADKRANRNSMKKVPPNKNLLKAQLLFDGAYYPEALGELEMIRVTEFEKEEDKLEYYYRLGRIYEGMNLLELALEYYQRTIDSSDRIGHYFAPKASLQAGIIHERKNNQELARQYYKGCLTYKNHSFKNSIDHQAKAGLNRLQK